VAVSWASSSLQDVVQPSLQEPKYTAHAAGFMLHGEAGA
jgi:hypothetical protein